MASVHLLDRAPAEHDRADHRDQQEHRGDLERHEVVAVEAPGRRPRVLPAILSPRPSGTRPACRPTSRRAAPCRAMYEERRAATIEQRATSADVELRSGRPRLRHVRRTFTSMIDEEEEHHDAAGVDEDLHGADELGLLQDEERRPPSRNDRSRNSAECTGLRARRRTATADDERERPRRPRRASPRLPSAARRSSSLLPPLHDRERLHVGRLVPVGAASGCRGRAPRCARRRPVS